MKKLAAIILTALALSGCGIYSFTGTSIQPDIKSITIDFFFVMEEPISSPIFDIDDSEPMLKSHIPMMTQTTLIPKTQS